MKENLVQSWDINGNLRTTLDQSLIRDCKKNYTEDESNAILPSIDQYVLEQGKTPKEFESERYP